MKSEHRHELKTNELAEWIANFPQWAQQNLKMIIYVSVIAALVAGSYLWHRYQKNITEVQKQTELTLLISQLSQTKMRVLEAHAQGIDLSYMLMQPADKLKEFAQNTKNNQMAALAMIKRAEAIRSELHYRIGPVNNQDLNAQMSRAKADYSDAINKASGNPSLAAAAKFGLGLCEEDLGNIDAAKKIYSEIAENTEFEGTTAFAQAKLRIDTMTDYLQPVSLKPSAKKTSAEVQQPKIKLEASDINLPGQ